MKKTFFLSIFLLAINTSALGSAVGEMPIPNPRDPSIPLECTPDINPWGNPSACNCVEAFQYNPEKGLCEVAQQGRLSGAVPHVGACENARGDVLFSIDRYQGGAVPYPDLVVFSAKLEINDRVKGYIEKTANGNFRVNNWPNDVDFVERTKRVISRTGDQGRGREIYTVLLVVKSAASGKSILRKRVTCESSWDYLRP